jgi:hypothetical protein
LSSSHSCGRDRSLPAGPTARTLAARTTTARPAAVRSCENQLAAPILSA